MIPIESLEGITIMGQSHLTTKCAEESRSHIFQRAVSILGD